MDQPLYSTDQQAERADPERAQREAMEVQWSTIENLISMRRRDAIEARQTSGIEDIWLEDEDQFNGYDELNPPGSGRRV
jgi:hypothetical protein